MKKLLVFSMLVLLFGSCTDDANELSNTDIQQGKWLVASYLDRGEDRTADFSGYVFEFREAAVVTASKGSTQVKGNWQRFIDSGKTKLIMTFSGPDLFAEISEDWQVLSEDAKTIELMHESGGDGHKGFLTLKATN